MGEALEVVAGAVVAYRLYDIAYAIDLAKVEAVWARRAGPGSRRGRLAATPPKAVAFGEAPVALALEPRTLELEDGPVEAAVTARLYDFGVLSSPCGCPRRACPGGVRGPAERGRPRRRGRRAAVDVWSALLAEIRHLLAEALVRPESSGPEEDYLLGLVHAFDTAPSAAELLERVDLVPLLSGERRPLSEGARADLLRQRFSYYADDLVALTWDRAFIYEPRGDSDVVDVLEVANAQLLEMRYYDELLDAELPRMYDLVEAARRAARCSPRAASPTSRAGSYTLVAEVTEVREKVDNALQVTEDVYLARVYAAALDLFRVPAVSAAVDRKLPIIRDTYTALYEEASAGRAELMELPILVLIALEIVLALLRH